MSDGRVLVQLAEGEIAALRVLCRRCLRALRAQGISPATQQPSEEFATNVSYALKALTQPASELDASPHKT